MSFKKISTLASCFILACTTIASANNLPENKDISIVNADQISISEWNEYKESDPKMKLNLMNEKVSRFSDIEEKTLSNENSFILHNDGKPISSNINVENETNLFGIYIDNIGDEIYMSYYFENVDRVNYENLVNDIKETESKNLKSYETINNNSRVMKNLYWTYSVGNSRFGRITTTVEGTRKSSNTVVDGKKSSVWDIKGLTQLELDNPYGRIMQQRTRLSLAKSKTEKLIDWAPDSNGSSSQKVSLDGLLSPYTWTFQANGFKYKDLSSKADRYGRWEFNSAVFPSSRWKSEPGIRATNSQGQFYVEVSHTAVIDNINFSGDIKGVYFADR
ncbi:hypothetical protein [Romboutsia hominis]|uniref:hypothetical protein n=1 Tax=Romboutsia hominis TaxID=1507512 RepID=UPI000B8A0F12|nr:hypothetical protein [Romboutsia hominis]